MSIVGSSTLQLFLRSAAYSSLLSFSHPSLFRGPSSSSPVPQITGPDLHTRCRPSQIVLVHGEANMMASLKKQLVSKYESGGEVKGIWSPQNTESVSLTFHESKVAKVGKTRRPSVF